MLPESSSQMNVFIFPLHLSNSSALTGGKIQKRENRIFSLKCCIIALPEFNHLLLDFFSCSLQLIFTLLYTP